MRRAAEPTARTGAVSWLGFAVRLAGAAVWIAAGAAKIPAIHSFQLVVQRYGILPDSLVAPAATVLPFVELFLGVYLAVGLFVRGSALVGTLLFALFLGAQAWALARGISLDCGCFGPAVETPVSPLTMLRDFTLGIPTFLMLAFPSRRLSLDRRLFGAPDFFI